MSFVSIIGIGICGFAVSLLLKQLNPNMAIFVTSACTIVLTVFAFGYFRPVISFFTDISQRSSAAPYAAVMLKLLAIGALTSVAADICLDSGEHAIASRIELLGKGAAAITVLPVLEKLIESVERFLT